jgi:hypothetical protein
MEKIKSGEEEKKDWHETKILKFPLNEIPGLSNHKESLTMNGSIMITEDEYQQITIWKRKVPTKKKPIYIVTKVEKIAN